MKSEIEQALLVLEHTERSTLLDCGADKRLKQLFQTTSSRRKAEDFDKSGSSPAKLAKLSQNQVRSPLLRAEFCTDSVLEACDRVAAACSAQGCPHFTKLRTPRLSSLGLEGPKGPKGPSSLCLRLPSPFRG